MVRSNYFDDYRNLPDYYDTMYLDGFTPQQVYAAFVNTRSRKFWEQQQEAAEAEEPVNVNIKSEVRVKK